MADEALSFRKRFWNAEARLAYALIAPTILFLIFFMFYPIIYVFVMSLFRTNQLSDLTKFIGLRNYLDRFTDREFWVAAVRSVIWTASGVGVKFLAGMIIAVLLNVRYRGRKALRLLFIIPWASSVPISTLLWQWVYHPEFGLLNHTLKISGLWTNPPIWLGYPLSAFIACLWVDIWIGIPFFALVFLAGMQAIPQELYESAYMDGAGGWRSYFSITLPGLRELILISTLLSAIWTFNDFNVIFILTRAGPALSTNILITSVYMNAFVDLRFDWAAVQAVVTFFVLTIVSVIYARFYFRRERD
ncbi:MAG TPA: sugar ABC transporter permease [Spirochaetia bacterium]|nr:sugar ABC transporter permease [Spirochaetia bacterium]